MLQIPYLTQHGGQQLLADLEYFGNVLAALGVALPPSLVTWEVRTGRNHVLSNDMHCTALSRCVS